MKKRIIWLLVVSIFMNLYLFGKDLWEATYTPTDEDQIILGEMVQKIVASEDYKKLDETEKVYSINSGVTHYRGGTDPFNHQVIVSTGVQTHFFSCADKTCSKMNMVGTMYSRYSDNEAVLPFKE